MTQIKLYAHQLEIAKFCARSPIVFNTSDPGTGKTRAHIEGYLRRKSSKSVLVLAPKSLLRSAWANDIERFAPLCTYSIAWAENREKAFKKDAEFYITNVDAVKWLAKQPKRFFDRFDELIIDESTAYKHHTSQRSKAARQIVQYFKYRRCLTGSPNTNTVLDLWHQVYLLDEGKRLGKSFYAFRNAVCIPVQVGPMPNMVKWEDRPNAETLVAALIRDINIRYTREDCLDLPPNHQYTVPFELSAKHMAFYRQMERMQVLELENKTVTAINGAAVATKLLQIASGAVYDDQGSYSLLDTSRYDLILDLVEARKYSVVFFLWTHQRDELIKAAKARGIAYAVLDGSITAKQKAETVDFFQKGFYQVLFAHPQSAAHGLTLTRGTAIIWASPTYNLEHFVQGNYRIDRAGQTQKTETIVVVAPRTIEEHVYAQLERKNVRLDTMLALLKEAA